MILCSKIREAPKKKKKKNTLQTLTCVVFSFRFFFRFAKAQSIDTQTAPLGYYPRSLLPQTPTPLDMGEKQVVYKGKLQVLGSIFKHLYQSIVRDTRYLDPSLRNQITTLYFRIRIIDTCLLSTYTHHDYTQRFLYILSLLLF